MSEKTRHSIPALLVTFAFVWTGLLLGGCHGGDGIGTGTSQNGTITVRVVWPELRQGEMHTQLIPGRSQSIFVEVRRNGDVINQELMVRPTEPPWDTTVSFDPVPAATLSVQATAFPNADGTGVAQAVATVLVIVPPGEAGYIEGEQPGTPVIMTLESTINDVQVSPDPATVRTGESVQLVASARDDQGHTVLVPTDDPFEWEVATADSALASVDGNGLVTGLSPGNATVQAKERESGVTGAATVNVTFAEGDYEFVTAWGTAGNGDGQFSSTYGAYGLAVDDQGHVYAVDYGNNRLNKFNSDGDFIDTWGTLGAGEGQFDRPTAVAVDGLGFVYVGEGDGSNKRIQKFSSQGILQAILGSMGSGDGQFLSMVDIAADAVGNVFATDLQLDRVKVFSVLGVFEMKFGSEGNGNGQFLDPMGVAVDALGSIFVADRNNHRIQKFSASGQFVSAWGSLGSEDGQFNRPAGVAVDKHGDVFVVDRQNRRVQKFSNNGDFLTKWGSQGTGEGQFYYPEWIAVDDDDNVYVTNYPGSGVIHYIQKYRPVP